MNAWRVIDELEEHEVECKNTTDGQIIWRVVREVNEDKFHTIQEREDILFCSKYCPVHHSIIEFSEDDFANSFWVIRPGNLEDDVKRLQKIIVDENKNKKEKHFRPIRQVL